MDITILVKQVYWYISGVSGERLQDHWSSGIESDLGTEMTIEQHHEKTNNVVFLAHLSRRLTGELIVYPCSGVRRRRSQFQRSFPLKPHGQAKPNFMWSILRKGE